MENLLIILQLSVALSVAFVWIFRMHNVIREFQEFGLSEVTRSFVGFSKTALATLLVVGIWFPSVVLISAILMGLFMLGAQYFHFSVKNPFIRRLPSLILLVMCVAIAALSY